MRRFGKEKPYDAVIRFLSSTRNPVCGHRILKKRRGNSEAHVYRARLEGHACRAREIAMDNPMSGRGPDKQVPPRVGGACLSRPLNRDGLSKVGRRTRQAGPSKRWSRRGTLVVPAKSQWIIQRCAPDVTSASRRERHVAANCDLPLFNRARTGDLPVNKPQTQALRMLPERDEMLLILVSFRV